MKFRKYQKNATTIKDYYLCGIRILHKEWGIFAKKTQILGITTSYIQPKYDIIENEINISDLFGRKSNSITYRPIDIIVPVYNGREHLDPLFESVIENTDLDYRLFIIDDCSSDEKVHPILKKWCKRFANRAKLLENETNLGFVQTVNRALSQTTNDVVILNTDVRVPKNWASRLMSPIFKSDRVASVTPFSNAATIFSFPQQWENNNLDISLQDMDDIFAKISGADVALDTMNFPTGVGFCMGMSRAALNKIGLLDTVFGRGYGEENDWCMRAKQAGFINSLAYNLFVYHKHGGSFISKEKQELCNKHAKIINSRYPDYNQLVQESGNSNVYQSLRFIAKLMYLNHITKKTYVIFDHALGGGTETYFYNKVADIKNNNLILRIQYFAELEVYLLTMIYRDMELSLMDKSVEQIYNLLRNINISELIVNNLVGYQNIPQILNIIASLKSAGNHVGMRGHDYQSICPFFTLINNHGKYCGIPNMCVCRKCFHANSFNADEQIHRILMSGATDIDNWRHIWGEFFEKTLDEMIVFSSSGRDIFMRAYPCLENKIQIVPHSVMPLRTVRRHTASRRITIGILGNISSYSKGKNITEQMHKLCHTKKARLLIIGTCDDLKNISQTGKYSVSKLPDILEKNHVDIIFIPSVWPETFSYTTSEAINMNIPVACFDIGAPAERVKQYVHGLVIDKIDANYALDRIITYVKNNEAR